MWEQFCSFQNSRKHLILFSTSQMFHCPLLIQVILSGGVVSFGSRKTVVCFRAFATGQTYLCLKSVMQCIEILHKLSSPVFSYVFFCHYLRIYTWAWQLNNSLGLNVPKLFLKYLTLMTPKEF